MQYLVILGSNPSLSIVELESMYGAKAITARSDTLAVIAVDKILPISRLGGTQKIAVVEANLSSLKPADIIKPIKQLLSADSRISKLNLGISAYQTGMSVAALKRLGIALKQELKTDGKACRIVPNRTPDLSTATVYHNRLTTKGIEIIIAKINNKLLMVRTLEVQDINAYTKRDRERPKRDARVGMLPPKLAQIMLNLAVNQAARSLQPVASNTKVIYTSQPAIYDPFCGTGVLLQEAILMGYRAAGSDIDERMVAYSKENLTWLAQKYAIAQNNTHVYLADARTAQLPEAAVSIVSETFLGPPLKAVPTPENLTRIVSGVDSLLFKSLENFSKQLSPGSRHCIAVPVWHVRGKDVFLPLIDQIPRLGYNLLTFKTVNGPLIYRRPQSIVGRQLLVLEKK